MKYIMITFLFLFSCNSTEFIKKPPFKIIDAYYQNWYGGREGVKGIAIKIKLTDISKNIKFKNLYFRKNKLDVSVSNFGNDILLSANINTGYKPESLTMHINPRKEFKNKLPVKNNPFKLKETEAIIEYIKNNKHYYYKITATKKQDLFMP